MNIINELFRKRMVKKLYKSVGECSDVPIRNAHLSGNQFIKVGNYCSLGPGLWIEANAMGEVLIKDGTILAPNVTIITRSHRYDDYDLHTIPYDEICFTCDVIIEEGVWVGQNVIILPGVRVGRGAIIGAGSVVSKSIPSYAIAAGNPCRILKYRDSERFENLFSRGMYVKNSHTHKAYKRIEEKDFLLDTFHKGND